MNIDHPLPAETITSGTLFEAVELFSNMERIYVTDLERGTRNTSVRAVERLAMALNVGLHQALVPIED